jgi:peptidoglycan/xylan/chitin deacetylase (PgdA/CDA1 family)
MEMSAGGIRLKINAVLFAAILVVLLGGCKADEAHQAVKDSKTQVNEPDQNEGNGEQQETKKGSIEAVETGVEKPGEASEDNVFEETSVTVPKYKLREDFSIQSIENPDEKIVLLTIDDAPDEYALTMAKTLKDLNVKAIFFVNGHFIDTPEEGEVLKQIHQMGFPIGNHTYSHKTLKELTEEQQKQEIVGLNDRIEALIGERPKFFRAPFGMNTDYSKKIAAEEGMLLMNWTYGYDWEKGYQTKEALADIMVNTPLLRNGANLLMHDREWTSAALGDIVNGLQKKGFKIADPELIQIP